MFVFLQLTYDFDWLTVTDTSIQDTSTSPESLQTSPVSSGGSVSSSLEIEPTQAQSKSSAGTSDTIIPTLTVEPTTSSESTANTDLTPTWTGINEPDGRRVIFQVVVPGNKERDLNKRAIDGFVCNENPNVCTFATTFNLANGQLFDSGLPVSYSGEDFRNCLVRAVLPQTPSRQPSKNRAFRLCLGISGYRMAKQASATILMVWFTLSLLVDPLTVAVKLAVYGGE